MRYPVPRGRLSALLGSWLDGGVRPDPAAARRLIASGTTDILDDEDLQLTLWALYELHYRGFDGVADSWEWDPHLIEVKASMEERFEQRLRELTGSDVEAVVRGTGALADRLFELVARDDAPSISKYVQRRATHAQAIELLVLRSLYALNEADAHSWAIPRIAGPAKVALVSLQFDEYGEGEPTHQHSLLYAAAMDAVGLDSTVGSYLEAIPAPVLAANNVISMLGLNRRLVGACMGHLAAFEATSSIPARQISQGMSRLRLPQSTVAYFDEHVTADAVHEQLAARDICAGLTASGQATEADVAFGAAACLLLDARVATWVLPRWRAGRSALRLTSTQQEGVSA